MDYVNDGLLSCPTCGLVDFKELAGGEFPAVFCTKCGLGIERYVAVPADAYDALKYGPMRDGGAQTLPSLRWHHDVAVARYRLNQLRHLLPIFDNRLWCDVGCGSGAVLSAAQTEGWHVFGVDVETRASHTTPYRYASLNSFLFHSNMSFDVVSMFDVLEHSLDPANLVRAAGLNLSARTGSLLVVEVPDLSDATDFLTWKHRRVSKAFTEHVYHFNKTSLETMVAKYTTNTELIHTAHPVSGKLQMVWRRL